jgi:hypothetical protein
VHAIQTLALPDMSSAWSRSSLGWQPYAFAIGCFVNLNPFRRRRPLDDSERELGVYLLSAYLVPALFILGGAAVLLSVVF